MVRRSLFSVWLLGCDLTDDRGTLFEILVRYPMSELRCSLLQVKNLGWADYGADK